MSSSDRPNSSRSEATLREVHLFMRFAREWELRFEKLLRTGSISKWYSAVGNEALTVSAAQAIERGDALLSLHRDSGAILRYYLEPADVLPGEFSSPPASGRRGLRADGRALLDRLASQVLGRADGFTGGFDRSYHYNYCDDEAGAVHVGMISHLGAMLPVATGIALALERAANHRVALAFIGDGGTSTGDFHEALNLAAVMRLPLIVVIENNGYAFSTATSEQYACASLALRGAGYGVPGVEVDGGNVRDVLAAVADAVGRARAGEGPTLIEARVGRMRGHSEGDDSAKFVVDDGVVDPLESFERELVERGAAREDDLLRLAEHCASCVLDVVDRALARPSPNPGAERPIYAE